MTRLLLIRHGETDWNREGRFQGSIDTPLNEAGRAQARAVGGRLQAETIDAVFSSPLARTYDTAREIARPHCLPILTDPNLREISWGKFEGMTRDEISARYPAWQQIFASGSRRYTAPDGETRESLAARVRDAIESIVRMYPDATVAVVTHGGTLSAVMKQVMGLPPHASVHIKFKNCSISELKLNDGHEPVVMRVNDTAHLLPVAVAA